MKQSFKLFNFQGTPVSVRIWFFLFFLILPPILVFVVFLSVLIHELGHAWMANRKGYQVYGVTVDMISGAASMDANIHDKDSIQIVAAGPICTLILCVLGYLITPFCPVGSIQVFMLHVYNINLFLFIFNILPIYPMDGGQIVRSYANLSKNRYTNRRLASWLSLTFSGLVLVYSLYSFNLFMILFAVYFGYLALNELGYIKKIKI